MSEPNNAAAQEYVAALQAEILNIVNGIKEEMGIDTPIEITIKEPSTDE